MGYRDDDFVDDERADLALRRVLARMDEPALVEPPPDLVARTARRLPAAPPARLARAERRHRMLHRAIAGIGLGGMALLALLGLWGALGAGPPLALLIGDGAGGIGQLLLLLHLLAKPLLGILGALALPLLIGGGLAAAAAAWMWRLALRRAPAYASVESMP